MIVAIEIALTARMKLDQLMEQGIIWQKPHIDGWPAQWHPAPARGRLAEKS
ncbi:hypothetical protein D3C71_1080250 [compost metagenome]